MTAGAGAKLIGGKASGRDHAINAIAPNFIECGVNIAFMLQGEQEHAQPMIIETMGQLGQYLGIVKIGEIRNQHCNEIGTSSDQAGRDRIGLIAKLVGSLFDALPG